MFAAVRSSSKITRMLPSFGSKRASGQTCRLSPKQKFKTETPPKARTCRRIVIACAAVDAPTGSPMRPLVIFACIACATALGVSQLAAQTPSSATPQSLAYKGFNYVSYYNGAYENADSLPALVATGANTVALDIEYGIDVVNSAVYADANYTDSLTALAATITEAKGDGLTVMVRPLIDFLDPAKIGTYSVGDWRSFYNPPNPAAFFASYQSMIVAVAQVAQTNGATMLCIGV